MRRDDFVQQTATIKRQTQKNNYFFVVFLIIFFISHWTMAGTPPLPNGIDTLISQYNMLLQARKQQGQDVKQAEEFDRQSRAAMAQQNPALAESLLKEAIALLQGSHTGSLPSLPQGAPAPPPPGILPSAPIPSECDSIPTVTLDDITQHSPFGIFGPYQFRLDSNDVMNYEKINAYLSDIGVKWVQEMPMDIGRVPSLLGIYSRVGREGGATPPVIDYPSYTSALRQTINCYKKRVKYWEIDTEPGGLPPPMGWKGHEKEYADFLKESYKVIKDACPDCMVVLGGAGGIANGNDEDWNTTFIRVLQSYGIADFFDVFSFKMHHYKVTDYVQLKNKLTAFRKMFSDHGIDLMQKTIFLETASYAGNPAYLPGHPLSFISLPPQTEFQQAAGLVKTYIFSIAQGIDRIFWNEIFERHDFGGEKRNPFNFYGLVHNPLNDDGQLYPKLAYHAYKKMVEVLEGSDWTHVITLKEENGLFMYKFHRQGKAIIVAWNDTAKEVPVDVPGLRSKKIRITHAVPDKQSGLEVDKNASAFHLSLIDRKGETVRIILGDNPLYIEETE